MTWSQLGKVRPEPRTLSVISGEIKKERKRKKRKHDCMFKLILKNFDLKKVPKTQFFLLISHSNLEA